MQSEAPLNGACLCAAITFELHPSQQYGPDRVVGVCHCTRCQQWSGGGSWPFIVVAPERFRATSGQELMAFYRDDQSQLRIFCRHCGSSLYYDTGTTYHVAIGVMRDFAVAPTFHIEVGHTAAWDPITDDNPQYADLPAVLAGPPTASFKQTIGNRPDAQRQAMRALLSPVAGMRTAQDKYFPPLHQSTHTD
jgi:hypothetical protein